MHIAMGDQVPAHIVVAGADEADQIPREARRPAALGHDLGAAGRLGRRFEDDGVADGQRSENPARRYGHREVPRGNHQHHPERLEPHQFRVGQAGPDQIEGPLAVPAGEVDGLGHLGIGLGDGLVALVDHGRHQVAPPAAQLVRRPPQQVPALGGRPGGPARLLLGGGRDDPVHAGDIAGGRGSRPAPMPGDDLAGPGPVRGQRRVGVGLVEEAAGRVGGLRRAVAVLASARDPPDRPPLGDRGTELGRLGLEGGAAGLQAEQVVDEVLVGGVLLQAAEQVGDGHVEVLGGHRGRVQQHFPISGAQPFGLGGRHALEHLEPHPVTDVALVGQQVGPGHVEEVVAGHADAH